MLDQAIVETVLRHAVRVDIESAAQRLLAAIDPTRPGPTLLIVGDADDVVIELNRAAMRRMRAHAELAIVPGAAHLFEEPGTLDQVSRLAVAWCGRYLWRARP